MRGVRVSGWFLAGVVAVVCFGLSPAVGAPVVLQPPVAKKSPKRLEIHGQLRVDDYYWLKERQDPAVIAYLEAENAYTEAVMAHTAELQEQLYQEIIGRIKQDDQSAPYRKGSYLYYSRYQEGENYPLFCRRRGSMEASEQVMLDADQLAQGHEFFSVIGLKVSSGEDILAYAVDTVGRRKYTLRFRNLATGEDLADSIPDVTGNSVWANDNRTLFYTKQHPETLRWYRIYKHRLGTDPASDTLVFEEADEEFSTFVSKTKSERFVLIGSQQTLSSEYRYLDASEPGGEFRIFLPREKDHEYSIDHLGADFYVVTNWQAKNFRVMKAPIGAATKESWVEVIPHRDEVLVEEIELFSNHFVVAERRNGLTRMRIMSWDGTAEHDLDFGEPTYLAWTSDNYELDSSTLRYTYTSLTTPWSTIDYEMVSRQKTVLKEEEVLGGFDKKNYQTERLQAPARDGVMVPISLVYRKDLFKKDGTNPLLLYGYGSYGASIDPRFSSARLSLLERGFVYAIAHIRGGQELGRWWYEDGKLLKKMNTFTDFIDCGRYLVTAGYGDRQLLFAMGGSAGGLLMGAVTNMAPELFAGVINQVPFVDVITTMLEPEIPLTTEEYDEWGDPGIEEYYDYILSYSPYDNLEAKAYPNILVTTGLHDSQVQYWEPAKYVAKLRALKTDRNLLLLKTNMEAGHGGATGRLKRHRETALDYAFLLDLVRGRTASDWEAEARQESLEGIQQQR